MRAWSTALLVLILAAVAACRAALPDLEPEAFHRAVFDGIVGLPLLQDEGVYSLLLRYGAMRGRGIKQAVAVVVAKQARRSFLIPAVGKCRDHVAAVEGAVYAGMRFFAGYPITPSTEVAEVCSRVLPRKLAIISAIPTRRLGRCGMRKAAHPSGAASSKKIAPGTSG